MNVMTRPDMSLDEFLAWEAGQDGKWEYDGKGPVEMTGGTLAHALIQANLIAALHRRLAGTPFRVFGSELKIQVDGRIRYPEAFVTKVGAPADSTVIHDPIVVFEVISPSTEQTDRFTKNHEYAATPSIQRYVMLEQGVVGATVFARTGAEWIGRLLLADAVLHMPEIATEVPLAEFYTGLFPAA
jgi:Uma2 family endonuclease